MNCDLLDEQFKEDDIGPAADNHGEDGQDRTHLEGIVVNQSRFDYRLTIGRIYPPLSKEASTYPTRYYSSCTLSRPLYFSSLFWPLARSWQETRTFEYQIEWQASLGGCVIFVNKCLRPRILPSSPLFFLPEHESSETSKRPFSSISRHFTSNLRTYQTIFSKIGSFQDCSSDYSLSGHVNNFCLKGDQF